QNNSLIWFDYDTKLYDFLNNRIEKYILDDLELVTAKAKSSNIFILTIDIKCPFELESQDKFHESFEDYLSYKFKKQGGTSSNEEFDDRYKYMIQDILANFIEEKQKFSDIKFHKICSFCYRDKAEMYTLAGIYDTEEHYKIISNELRASPFYNESLDHIYDIDVPILTYKEKTYLDSNIKMLSDLFSNGKGEEVLRKELRKLEFEIDSPEMLKKYVEYYRYYPQYYEGIL
ncbi:MAG: O-methyltransferase, partial [Candidatus Zixiibacteriota bacterium]